MFYLGQPEYVEPMEEMRMYKAQIFWTFFAIVAVLFLGLVVGMFLSRHWREWTRRKRARASGTPIHFGEEKQRQEG